MVCHGIKHNPDSTNGAVGSCLSVVSLSKRIVVGVHPLSFQ